jgi:hypothetical protein
MHGVLRPGGQAASRRLLRSRPAASVARKDARSMTPDLKGRAAQVLRDATIPELPNHYRGKVRDNYDLADGSRILIATDRLSAFDRFLAAIPFKGQVLRRRPTSVRTTCWPRPTPTW